MHTRQHFNGFELKDPAVANQCINEASLLKRVERNIDRLFETHAGDSMSKFGLVNPFIEKSTDFIMDQEDVPHNFKRNLGKLLPRDSANRDVQFDWHGNSAANDLQRRIIPDILP